MADENKIPSTWKKCKVKLIGINGNAFAIMGACKAAAKKAGNSVEDINILQAEMTNGDYDNLLQTAMIWFDVS